MDITGYALVVGGGSGIGKACAMLFAKEGAAGVMVADLDANAARDVALECATVATNPKFQVEAQPVDITREDSVQEAVSRIMQVFGRIDYCVNCAGIGVQQGTDIVNMSLAEFRRFLDINTTGMFLVTREVSAAMRGQDPIVATTNRGAMRGAIVNLGSASSMVAAPGVLPYTASKHAAFGLTKNHLIMWVMASVSTACVRRGSTRRWSSGPWRGCRALRSSSSRRCPWGESQPRTKWPMWLSSCAVRARAT